jgi:hypothetical protein
MKAFPLSVMYYEQKYPDSPRYTTNWHEGMDLRDYFAAAALQGMIPDAFQEAPKDYPQKNLAGFWSEMAYEIADAMMKARTK